MITSVVGCPLWQHDQHHTTASTCTYLFTAWEVLHNKSKMPSEQVTRQPSIVYRLREPVRLRRREVTVDLRSERSGWIDQIDEQKAERGGRCFSPWLRKGRYQKRLGEVKGMQYGLEVRVWETRALDLWKTRWGGFNQLWDPGLGMRMEVSLKHRTLLILKSYLWIFICVISVLISTWNLDYLIILRSQIWGWDKTVQNKKAASQQKE